MIIAPVVAVIILLTGIFVSWTYGLAGVSGATLVTGIFVAVSLQMLKGIGNQMPKSALPTFLMALALAGFFYSGIHFFHVRGQFLIWLVALVVGTGSYFGWRYYFKSTAVTYRVTLGYDPELPLQWHNVRARLKDGAKSEIISFNAGSGLKEPGPEGFRASISGSSTIHFKPTELEVSFFKAPEVSFKLDPELRNVTVYYTKEKETRFFQK